MFVTDRITVNSLTVPVTLATNTRASAKIDKSDDFGSLTFTIKNRTGTGIVVLGSTESGLAQNRWFEWEVADGPFTFTLEPGETLEAILAVAGNQVVHVIRNGR
jgi:hypothetical protein